MVPIQYVIYIISEKELTIYISSNKGARHRIIDKYYTRKELDNWQFMYHQVSKGVRKRVIDKYIIKENVRLANIIRHN